MYVCNECQSIFENLDDKKINFELEYGVSHLFTDNHTMTVKVSPCCKTVDYDELKECDYCGELFKENELEDTSEAINGGCGYLCEQCINDCDIII